MVQLGEDERKTRVYEKRVDERPQKAQNGTLISAGELLANVSKEKLPVCDDLANCPTYGVRKSQANTSLTRELAEGTSL